MTKTLTRLGAGLLLLTACKEPSVPQSSAAVPAAQDLSAEQQQKLKTRRIFFGHQSVGGNVMDGLGKLAEAGTPVPLKVEKTLNLDSSQAGVLAHEWIGENEHPKTKLDALDAAVRGSASGADVVMFKFCYTDFGKDVDPAQVFAAYRDEVRALRSLRPGLTLVHITTPVPEPEGTIAYMLRKARGKMTLRERIAKINRYNDLLKQEFGGKEPLFDLALLESQGPDGNRATVAEGGQALGVLNPAWSADGSHLNDAGRTAIAKQLLVFLADSLPAAPAS